MREVQLHTEELGAAPADEAWRGQPNRAARTNTYGGTAANPNRAMASDASRETDRT